MTHKDLVVHHFKTPSNFIAWLKKNWEQPESIWLKIAKKNTGAVSLSYEEAREVAISYGWIDGLINKLDEEYYLLKFSKRRPRSMWSKINREIATTLITEKKMQPSGLAEVERARADGRWDAAYDSPKTMTVPRWFVSDLKQHKRAYEFYKTLNKTNRYYIAAQLRMAKREETKQRRAAKFIALLQKQDARKLKFF